MEAALAHVVRNKAEAACARSDLFEKRRAIDGVVVGIPRHLMGRRSLRPGSPRGGLGGEVVDCQAGSFADSQGWVGGGVQTLFATSTAMSRMWDASPTLTVRSGQRSSSARSTRRPSRLMRSLTTDSPPRPGVANRDQAALHDNGVSGVDRDVVAHPHARTHGVLGDARDERLAAKHRPPAPAPPRRERARGPRNGAWGGRHPSAPAPPTEPGAPHAAGYT